MANASNSGANLWSEILRGSHLCYLYESNQSLLDTLIPFLEAGLRRNEYCLWVTPDFLSVSEAKHHLVNAFTGSDRRLTDKGIEIIQHGDWYQRGDALDLEKVMIGWNEKLRTALEQGYAGLTVTGDMSWLGADNWSSFLAYEKQLNTSIKNQLTTFLCTYPASRRSAAEVLDVAAAHDCFIAGRGGEPLVLQSLRRNVGEDLRAEKSALDSVAELAALGGAAMKVAEPAITDEAPAGAEERFRSYFELGLVGMAVASSNQAYIELNNKMCEILGYERPELLGMTWLDLMHPEDRPLNLERLDRVLAGEMDGYSMDQRFIRRNGRVIDTTISVKAQRKADGSIDYFVLLLEDVTARKSADAALRESEERYRLLFESNPHPIWVLDLETLAFLDVNGAALLHYGYSREEFLKMTARDIRPPEDISRLETRLADWSQGSFKASPWRHLKKDGTIIEVEVNSHLFTYARRSACVVLVNDVTSRNRAEAAIRNAEAKYRSIFENAVEGIFQFSLDGKFLAANPATARILGFESAEELIACTNIETDHYVDKDSWRELHRMLEDTGEAKNLECEVFRKDGSIIWVVENIRAIRDESGAIAYCEGSFEDITERKVLEEQLRQAVKMEAIGQLAGGIAHDFNNLLIAITGYGELAIKRLTSDDPLRRDIEGIMRAGERAASLTAQLLAFSRKQVLQPRVLNLNSVVSETEGMLRRLIGENIELRTALTPGLGSIRADPGQIEQVIVNLAVNARDAMPLGGTLTIETENICLDGPYRTRRIALEPGLYVALAVSDTGGGIDEQTLRRIFEPFFTTKETGKGTGLGLSTVYGIVKQSGGDILVYSEVGRGTTFRIYLPRLVEDPDENSYQKAPEATLRGSETILMAEDDEMVRTIAREILESYGYKVLDAAHGDAAILVCALYVDPIDLLVSDVVMPKMSGTELAGRLTEARPELKVLYMSGYTDNAVVHRQVLDNRASFIQKPFTPEAFARKVREVLDAP